MKKFKGVIFDMDGLLLDSERLALSAFDATCTQFSLGNQTHIFKQCVGLNAKLGAAVLEKALNGMVDHDEFGVAWENRYAELIRGKPVPLKAGAKDLLDYIKSIGIPMAVATSTKTDRAEGKLLASGILNFFQIVIGGDQVLNGKPDPEPYLKAAAALRVAPLTCLALEDSPNGVRSAVAASMTVVQIPDLIQPTDEFLKAGHIVLNSLADVPAHNFTEN